VQLFIVGSSSFQLLQRFLLNVPDVGSVYFLSSGAPAGFSAAGQPCDQLHAVLHSRIDKGIREKCGAGKNLMNRPEVQLNQNGNMRSLSLEEIIEVDVVSWRSLPRTSFAWAWIVCGYLSAT
jgi:hypothetical protein